jgi:hypothetical protein
MDSAHRKISPCRVRSSYVGVNEAKDFLIKQTGDQAQRDRVPLSDFEKRTMYLTKSNDAVENPTEVNSEFEAQHNGPEYEAKIAPAGSSLA